VKRRGPDSGYIVIVALIVILIAMTAALLAAASLQRRSRLVLEERQNVELTAMADGALAKALSSLWRDPDYGGGTEPFAGGTITIEVAKVDGLTVEVTVWAALAGRGRAARARVRIDRDPPDRRDPPRVLRWEPLPAALAAPGSPVSESRR
jgi:hypothetical protein